MTMKLRLLVMTWGVNLDPCIAPLASKGDPRLIGLGFPNSTRSVQKGYVAFLNSSDVLMFIQL